MSDLKARLRDDEWVDMEHRARTKRMHHDDQWYGPMKGTQCRCSECLLAIDLLAALADRAVLLRALNEVHEYQCGCDRPGDLARCVARPADAFEVLNAGRNQEATASRMVPDGRGGMRPARGHNDYGEIPL